MQAVFLATTIAGHRDENVFVVPDGKTRAQSFLDNESRNLVFEALKQ